MQPCTIFRSSRKEDTYLYLAQGLEFSDLPETLRHSFGEPVEVMSLDVTSETRLANAENQAVMQALTDPGYYLQFPPKLPIEDEISRRFGKSTR